jgi:hypothetical protein
MSNEELNEDTGIDETGTEGTTPQVEVAATTDDAFSMPEKFAGKSAEEVAQSYTKLESELGRKNNEVGELRKLTDQYIHQELSRRTSSDPTQESELSIEFDDLVEDPNKVVGNVVDSRMKSVNERMDQMEQTNRVDAFKLANPDYEELAASQEFYNWTNASPYRKKQLEAAQAGDLDAAGDVLQGYREQSSVMQKAQKTGEKVKRDTALKDANTESSGTGASSGKMWTRAELMKLQIKNPEKYWSMTDEIHKAYAEGRVK